VNLKFIFIDCADSICPFITLLFLLPIYKKVEQYQKILLCYLIISIIVMGIGDYMAAYVVNNLFLYHGYSLFEVCIFMPYLYLQTNKKIKPAIIIGCTYTVFWVINIIFWEPLSTFNSNSAAIASILISAASLKYLLALTSKDEIMYFQKLPGFWIVSGLLFYNIVSLLVVASYKYDQYFRQFGWQMSEAWQLQIFANIVKYILTIIGILCYYRQTSQATS